MHEAYEPNAIVELLDSEPLTRQQVETLIFFYDEMGRSERIWVWKGYSTSGNPS